MTTFILTFLFLCAMVAAMAIGVMRGRAPIAGTCGGLNNMDADGTCEICGGKPAACEKRAP
jgi:hypothetical protein